LKFGEVGTVTVHLNIPQTKKRWIYYVCLISFFLKVYKLELVVSIRFHWYFAIEQEFCSLEWTTPVFQRFNDSTDTMSSERIQIERAMRLIRSRIKPPHSLI